MRNSALTLSCILLAGVAAAQQATSTPSSTAAPAASKAPATSSTSGASKTTPGAEPETPPPANPLTDAQAHEMLDLTGADKIKAQLIHGYINYFHTNMPFLPKDVSEDLEQSFDKLDLNAPIIAIYKQHISADDATAIITFYKTPAGKNMIDAMPMILQQTQQVGMQLGRKTAQEVVQRHREEIETAAKQYREEHAPKPAPASSTPGASPSAAPSSQPAAKPSSSSTPSATTPQQK
jgi:hypothetical protein